MRSLLSATALTALCLLMAGCSLTMDGTCDSCLPDCGTNVCQPRSGGFLAELFGKACDTAACDTAACDTAACDKAACDGCVNSQFGGLFRKTACDANCPSQENCPPKMCLPLFERKGKIGDGQIFGKLISKHVACDAACDTDCNQDQCDSPAACDQQAACDDACDAAATNDCQPRKGGLFAGLFSAPCDSAACDTEACDDACDTEACDDACLRLNACCERAQRHERRGLR